MNGTMEEMEKPPPVTRGTHAPVNEGRGAVWVWPGRRGGMWHTAGKPFAMYTLRCGCAGGGWASLFGLPVKANTPTCGREGRKVNTPEPGVWVLPHHPLCDEVRKQTQQRHTNKREGGKGRLICVIVQQILNSTNQVNHCSSLQHFPNNVHSFDVIH